MLQRLARQINNVIFRQIEVHLSEEAGFDGPVLGVANHFGGLSDALLLVDVLPRTPRFLANDTLWKVPLARHVMRAVRGIPVYRRERGSRGDPNAMFSACYEALAAGDLVLIFPEGVTVETPHIAPIKTGAARIALGALQAGLPEVKIVPIGLHYSDKAGFRSSALVNTGPSLVVRPPGDPTDQERVRELTAEIETALRAAAPNFPDWDTARDFDQAAEVVLHDVDAGAVPLHYGDRVLLANRMAAHASDSGEIATRAHAYHQARNWLGADDLAVRRAGDHPPVIPDQSWGFRVALSLLLAPYALVGLALIAIPWLLFQVSRLFRLAPAVQASLTPALAILAFGGQYVWLTLQGWQRYGWQGVIGVVLIVPFFSACAALVTEQVGLLWRRWRVRRLPSGERTTAALAARTQLSELSWRLL
ncbi:MAG: 1-acyl-sn-glycerol-3-phosphate acyltransferase [Candidatus Nanopelagicales bacterium]